MAKLSRITASEGGLVISRDGDSVSTDAPSPISQDEKKITDINKTKTPSFFIVALHN